MLHADDEVTLDHVLVFGRRHLERVLEGYTAHYNAKRPHRSLGKAPPNAPFKIRRFAPRSRILRRDVLGGLIREYHPPAA